MRERARPTREATRKSVLGTLWRTAASAACDSYAKKPRGRAGQHRHGCCIHGAMSRRKLFSSYVLSTPLLLALISACAGKARQDAPLTGDVAGASPSNAGSSSVDATAGLGGSAGHGMSGGSGAAGATPMACLQPVAPTGSSSCDFNSYAFDLDSGYCAYFEKSNCTVTNNRFDTLEACIAACDPAASAIAGLQATAWCVAWPAAAPVSP